MSVLREQAKRYELLIGEDLLLEVGRSMLWGQAIGNSVRVHVHNGWRVIRPRKESAWIFVSNVQSAETMTNLRRMPQIQSARKRFLLISDEQPIEILSEILTQFDVRDPQRLYVLTRKRQPDVGGFLSRLVYALERRSDGQAILDAFWDGETLVVVSPFFERLHIPRDKIPRIREERQPQESPFEIDEYGDFIYWPDHDVHMGWSQFLQAVDPQAKLRAEQKSEAFNQAYGAAIRRLREESKLHQSGITGLDERTVRRIEKGETRATAAAIAALASAHNMSQEEYMQRLAQLIADD